MRKLASIRAPGFGNRTWAGARYAIPGLSSSVSLYDKRIVTAPTNMTRWTPNGLFDPHDVPARPARESAIFDSAMGAFTWQGSLGNLHFSNLTARPIITRTLTQNYNRNQAGSKEQQRATVYAPWPGAGAIFPKAL